MSQHSMLSMLSGTRGRALTSAGLFAAIAALLSWPSTLRSSSEGRPRSAPVAAMGSGGFRRAVSPKDPRKGIDVSRSPRSAIPVRVSVFSPDSALPVADRSIETNSAAPAPGAPASEPGCTICLEGYVYNWWSGSSGYLTADRVANNRSSGVSGSLRIQMRLTTSWPVFGQTISSYQQSDSFNLGTLAAGYYFHDLDSGTIAYYNSSIPSGTYYQLMMLYEYSGATWYYTDFIVMDNVVSCSGSGCTTSSSPTPTPTRPQATATPTTPPSSCYEDAYSLCLYNSRFRVQATYRDYSGNTGSARGVKLTSDSGYFWFFSSANVELVAKIVSFCSGSSGQYGLYASGLTDVSVTFVVTDTRTGTTRQYVNPLGNRFCTIGDAWNVCP